MSYVAVCEGEVVLRDGRGVDVQFYEVDVNITEEFATIDKARHLVQAGIIGDVLRREYSNFKNVRTCQVVEIKQVEKAVKQDDQQAQLQDLIMKAHAMNCLPDNIENYKRPDYKIKALERAIEAEKKRRDNKKEKAE